ncbi:MAG: hypothetical protein WBW84_14400 [Acidobacteriaceae bacterium]
MNPAKKPLLTVGVFRGMAWIHCGETQMRSDPDDEPVIYLVYALMMFVAIIAAGVIAAGILVHVNL